MYNFACTNYNCMEKKIYGLIGMPLGHSFSRSFFTEKFEREGIDAEYRNFELPDVGDLMELIAEYPHLAGLNVTLPYKQAVIPYMDYMSDTASGVGAVNVIRFERAGDDLRLGGYNTDTVGFAESLRPLLTPAHTRALVLGSGGASRAVLYALGQLGIEAVVVSRHPSEGQLSYADLTPGVMDAHRLIVNTTPVGMYPHVDECPDIPYQLLGPGYLCYDVVYNPVETLFMKKAAAQGAEVRNGLEMLHLQALAAWKIWNE